MTGPICTSFQPPASLTTRCGPVQATFWFDGTFTRAWNSPASLKNGWCQGMNGVSCQPSSS